MKVFFLVILFAIANAKSIEENDDGKYSFKSWSSNKLLKVGMLVAIYKSSLILSLLKQVLTYWRN